MEIIVETRSGALRGVVDGGVSRFLGVPFAASPAETGWLLPPEPVRPWEGARDALEYGATVPKSPYPWPSSELLNEIDIPGDDCLNLNVWTPGVPGDGACGIDPEAASAPVYVFIHGGAWRNGSGSVPQYDGTAFARDGVVCVTVNYRLCTQGFLDVGDDVTNVGLRDQIAALTWVRENIAAFGGDPERVTIGGESAGAMSVGALLASPLAEGLFSAAILQSGAGHHALTRGTAQLIAGELAAKLGVEPTREAIAGVPLEALLEAQSEIGRELQLNPDPARWREASANLMAWEPVIGDDLLPTLPIEAIRAGASRGVRVLIGVNADEMLYFLAAPGITKQIDAFGYAAAVGALAPLGFPDPAAVVELYKGGRNETPGQVTAAVMSDFTFGIPAIRLAEARADAAPTYMYEFAWRSTGWGGVLGACHALELAFAFDTLAADGSENLAGPNPPQAVADDMHAAWVRFIAEGDPGWEPYTPGERVVRVFDDEPTVVKDPRAEQRVLWDGLR